MSPLRRRRLTTTLAMAAALSALIAALLPSVAAAATPRVAMVPITIGTGSCVGSGACDGATGPIGDGSCNGAVACEHSSGPIGDGSCNGEEACAFAPSVGDNSCNFINACISVTSVGNNSCNTSTIASCGSGSVIGNCVYNDVQPAACDTQPDGRIRRIGRTTTVGDDIYNTSAVDQTRTAQLGPGNIARFVITIQNDGSAPDSFRLGGEFGTPCVKVACLTAPSYPVGLTIYHGRPGTDITTAVMSGVYETPTIAPGGIYRIRVVYAAPASSTIALTTGTTLFGRVGFTSIGNPANADVVGFNIILAAST